MRINLVKKRHTPLHRSFIDTNITGFAKEFDIKFEDAKTYIMAGEQGLDAFTNYLSSIGYDCKSYVLKPNKDILRPFYSIISNEYDDDEEDLDTIEADKFETPSFGIIIKDDDEKLTEFKLKNL